MGNSSLWPAFRAICKRTLQGLTCPISTYVVRMGEWDARRAGPWQGSTSAPTCSFAEHCGSNPPMPDFLLLAFVLLCLPRAPNHSANSVCGERSPHVISRRISPLYSRLINSGPRYGVMMSYQLQECPPQRGVNITTRAKEPLSMAVNPDKELHSILLLLAPA